MIRTIPILLALMTAALPVSAAQSLIPTPYPGAVGGGQKLNPATPEAGGPQRLMDDPYPAAPGKESQGNPPISRTQGRHQRLVPSVKQRKYKVDRD